MAINIDIIADIRKFLSCTQDMEGALNDVADELDQLADASVKAAKKSEDALEDAFTDGTKDAQKSLEKLEDSIDDVGDSSKSFEKVEDALEEVEDKAKSTEDRVSDAFREMAKKAGDSGDKIGKSQKDGFDKAKNSADEFKDEANSTAKESAASFDGSAESIAGSFQEVAANAFAGFGPAGAAAGLAAAAGIGIAVAKLQKLAEGNTEAQQAVADLAAEFSELGGDIDALNIAEKIQEWGREVNEDNWLTFWVDEADTNFQKYDELAKEAGVTTKDAFRGMKGTVEESEGFLDATKKEFKRLSEEVEAGTEPMGKYGTKLSDNAREAKKKRDALEELREKASDNIATTEEAIEIYGIEEEAVEGTTDAILANIEALEERAGAERSGMETAISYAEQLDETTSTIATNGENLDINTKKGRENQQALIDLSSESLGFAEAQLEAGVSASVVSQKLETQRGNFIDAAVAAGYTRGEARKLADQYGLIPDKVVTDVGERGSAETGRKIDHMARERATKINVGLGSTYEVDNYILGKQGTKIYVDFAPRGGKAIT